MRIGCLYFLLCRCGLAPAGIATGIQYLSLQVTFFHNIAVGDADGAYSCRREVLQHGAAEAPGADDQYFCLCQALLPFRAYFGQEEVAAVTDFFLWGQHYYIIK
jgi:hypothetical protein